MTTYKITSPHFTTLIVASSDTVMQAAPVLHWTVGKNFAYVRDYCQARGWLIEPLSDDFVPQWLELDGQTFELHWNGPVISRITLHDDGEPRDLRFDELPEQLKKLL